VGSELELFARATRWKRYYGSHLSPYLGRRVVEVGAGFGSTTAALCRGREDLWLCLEPDRELASRIAAGVEGGVLPSSCQVRVGTSAALSVDDALDTALYIDVLEHIEDDHAEIAHIARIVRPGGHVAVMSPAHPFLFSPFDAAIGHHRRYTRRTLAAVAPPALQLVRLVYLDAVGMAASFLNRMFLRQSLPTAQQIAFWDGRIIPLSRLADPLLRHKVGKSILAVWRVLG
jgi:SAM-dependent methyltransferase